MACMDHSCLTCGKIWMDNKTAAACPRCGSREVTNDFDEVNDERYEKEDRPLSESD